jgi:hypothetical protein
MLSKLEVLNITETIDKAEISFSHLRDELIDHVCCEIEHQMEKGFNFHEAFENIKPMVGMRDLQKVQENTLLLIDKKYRIMKTTMKIFGVLAPVLMAFGALFKIQHWTGAGIILTLGFFLLTFVFLPSAIYVSYREVSNRTKLFMHLSGFLSAFLFAVSFLFKIQHWSGAAVAMVVAALITGFCFIPSFFINQIKGTTLKSKKVAYIFGLIGSFLYLAGFLFKIQHWPGASITIMSGTVFLILLAFPIFIVAHYKDRENVSSRFIFITFGVVWFIVPTLLIALNVSQDSLLIFKEMETENGYHLQFISAKNNKLYDTLLKENTPDSMASVLNIKKQTAELINYIQAVKMKIFNVTEGSSCNLEFNSQMDVKNLKQADKGDISFLVLFKEGEATKIKNKIEEYRQNITASGIDNLSQNLIAEVLNTSTPNNVPDFLNSWEKYNLMSSTLVTTMNKLSGLQEDVLTAEYLAVKSLSSKVQRSMD